MVPVHVTPPDVMENHLVFPPAGATVRAAPPKLVMVMPVPVELVAKRPVSVSGGWPRADADSVMGMMATTPDV